MVWEELKLEGKVALVTGGGRGLGRSMALALAEAGADVVVAARTRDQIEQTAAEIKKLGKRGVAIPADVTVWEQVQSLVDQVVSMLGRIDILVNNAGQGLSKPLMETSAEEWTAVLQTNLTGMFYCCKAVGKYLLAQRSGKVINIASGLGERGLPNSTAFAASKGGVIQLTRCLALEWAPYQVQVNAIGPGWFPDSPGGQESRRYGERLERFIPLGRRGRPEDLQGVVVYLASSASDFMTGEVIFVDGGVLIHA
ncbi:MAG: glucose 1-dehydrogenase [Nitrospinota bacterium]|nr:MAG: glucose 1-dehydrogenase [Nitrospinota bacterium]